MREDFDYVSMENYSKDTKDLIGLAQIQIEALRREKEEILQAFTAIVARCKQVEIYQEDLITANPHRLERHSNPVNNSIIFKYAE